LRNPYLQVLAARKPIGVGGVADALGSALGVLEVVGGIALVIIGVDVILKWTGHPLHHGR
jgi:small neutral amino acid transporter SnatA (MarC family)